MEAWRANVGPTARQAGQDGQGKRLKDNTGCSRASSEILLMRSDEWEVVMGPAFSRIFIGAARFRGQKEAKSGGKTKQGGFD